MQGNTRTVFQPSTTPLSEQFQNFVNQMKSERESAKCHSLPAFSVEVNGVSIRADKETVCYTAQESNASVIVHRDRHNTPYFIIMSTEVDEQCPLVIHNTVPVYAKLGAWVLHPLDTSRLYDFKTFGTEVDQIYNNLQFEDLPNIWLGMTTAENWGNAPTSPVLYRPPGLRRTVGPPTVYPEYRKPSKPRTPTRSDPIVHTCRTCNATHSGKTPFCQPCFNKLPQCKARGCNRKSSDGTFCIAKDCTGVRD